MNIKHLEIALVASGYLVSRNFSGHSAETLLGPADYSMNDFGALTGKGSRQMLITEESRSFFEPFNQGSFTIVRRALNNTTSNSDPRFYLEYFLENEYCIDGNHSCDQVVRNPISLPFLTCNEATPNNVCFSQDILKYPEGSETSCLSGVSRRTLRTADLNELLT